MDLCRTGLLCFGEIYQCLDAWPFCSLVIGLVLAAAFMCVGMVNFADEFKEFYNINYFDCCYRIFVVFLFCFL